MSRKKSYSTHGVATLLDCSAPAVIRWVEEGKLKAYRTPGGHRRILKKDLASFARQFGFPITDEESTFDVLLVDDDGALLKKIARSLPKLLSFAQVEITGDATTGLIAFGRRKPDLLVIGLDIGGANTLAILRTIRADPDNASVKILVLVDLEKRIPRKKLDDLGVSLVLKKPFHMEELAKAVAAALRE